MKKIKNYNVLLTVKSTAEINRKAAKVAKQMGRNRSELIREMITALAADQALQDAAKAAIDKGK